MSDLSREDIRHLSHLARLELSEEEYERYAKQLSSVVGYIELLQKVPTDSVQAQRGVTGLENVMMEDVPRPADDLCVVSTEDMIKGAPLSEENYIEVRAVLDEGGA